MPYIIAPKGQKVNKKTPVGLPVRLFDLQNAGPARYNTNSVIDNRNYRPKTRKTMSQQRLQKVMAAAGIGSRRRCEELIVEGAVRVNGKVVDELPAFADPDKDNIVVNGKRIRAEHKVYYLLNKPKGVICTSSDRQGRTVAADMIPSKERVFCVGRLDADTSGLILLTSDSELTNRLTHPRYELPKTYVARVKGRVEGTRLEKVKKGMWFAEGKAGRVSVKILGRTREESYIEIIVTNGLNRQVRLTLAKVGLNVKGLQRTRFGKLDLRGVGVGKFRRLTDREAAYLRKATGLD